MLYVASNMLVAAIVFLPWAMPRETISGVLGRWKLTEHGLRGHVGRFLSWFVDRLYWWDYNHCEEVYRVEQEAREVLYP